MKLPELIRLQKELRRLILLQKLCEHDDIPSPKSAKSLAKRFRNRDHQREIVARLAVPFHAEADTLMAAVLRQNISYLRAWGAENETSVAEIARQSMRSQAEWSQRQLDIALRPNPINQEPRTKNQEH